VGAEPLPVGALRQPLTERGLALVELLRGVYQEMVDAALGGDGLERVAELTAAQVLGTVTIVVPSHRVAVAWPKDGTRTLATLEQYTRGLVNGRSTELPPAVSLLVPVARGGETVGTVAMLSQNGPPAPDASEYLHLAALATVTALALEDARHQDSGGGLLAALRQGEVERDAVAGRAAAAGCEIARGAVAIVSEVRSNRPREAMALVAAECPEALVEPVGELVFAVLPAGAGGDALEPTVAVARRVADRLRAHGPVGISSFYADPAELGRAVQEAELVLEVVSRDERLARQLEDAAGSGVYRLLFRALASHPEEVRSFYEDTVAPLVHYDEQYHTDLITTLEAYLANDCNMNATARSIYAHRHTVAYRLNRVKELSQLDPVNSEDRERLSLGLKAYRIVAPTLPR
jgi:hypothetical protein